MVMRTGTTASAARHVRRAFGTFIRTSLYLPIYPHTFLRTSGGGAGGVGFRFGVTVWFGAAY